MDETGRQVLLMSPIDKIPTTEIELPFDYEAITSGDPERLADYIRELIESLQNIQSRVIKVANLVLDLGAGGVYYYDLPDENGLYPVGTWRILMVGTTLERQVLESQPDNWVSQGIWVRRKT